MAWHSSTILVNIHAITMLILPFACAIFLFNVPKRRPPMYAVVGWTMALGGLVAFQLMPCLCIEKHPLLQVIIPAACLWFVALYVSQKRARVMTCLFCGICLLGFQRQYEAWDGGDSWTSVPKHRVFIEKEFHKRGIADAEEALFDNAATDDKPYAAMWLSELPVVWKQRLDESRTPRPCSPRSDWVRCWHTPITGLYLRHVYSEQDYWYLGGPLKDAAGRIVVRDRKTDEMPTTNSSGA